MNLEQVFRRRTKRLFSVVAVGLFVVYLVLEVFVIYKHLDTSQKEIDVWVGDVTPKIQEALFLRNNLALEDNLLTLQKQLQNHSVNGTVVVLDPNGKVIFTLKKDRAREGWKDGLFEKVVSKRKITRQLNLGGFDLGTLNVEFGYDIFNPTAMTLVITLSIIGIMLVFRFALAKMLEDIQIEAFRPVVALSEKIERSMGEHASPTLFELETDSLKEIQELVRGYNKLVGHISETTKRLKDVEVNEARYNIAKQVAHDIRSPLAAMDMMFTTLKDLPEEHRILFRNAIGRIKDIANNLVFKAAGTVPISEPPTVAEAIQKRGIKEDSAEALSVELLPVIIDQIVSEKRLQYRSNLKVNIDAVIGADSYGIFANVAPSQLRRIISNLINNAVEALPGGRGRIRVELKRSQQTVLVSVIDDGKGIPADILPRLGQEGFSFGKEAHRESGSGIGLFHARTMVESWGGSLEIRSTVGTGSTITLRLVAAPTPPWFVPILNLSEDSVVVILDDDQSIHGIWRERFQSLLPASRNLFIQHFSTPNEVESFIKTRPQCEKSVYLFDFELIGQSKSGLDLIEELDLGNRAILVSSRFEGAHIRARCQTLGVKMIPKPMAAFVPIEIVGAPKEATASRRADIVLIDDDRLVHEAWKIAAVEKKKILNSFDSAADFFKVAAEFDLKVPVYIDQNLADGVIGTEVAKTVKGLGFQNVYLTTGEAPEAFKLIFYLSGVTGKDFPF